jgi:hypothetical protein
MADAPIAAFVLAIQNISIKGYVPVRWITTLLRGMHAKFASGSHQQQPPGDR